jgi:hypothetical protein
MTISASILMSNPNMIKATIIDEKAIALGLIDLLINHNAANIFSFVGDLMRIAKSKP